MLNFYMPVIILWNGYRDDGAIIGLEWYLLELREIVQQHVVENIWFILEWYLLVLHQIGWVVPG